MLASITPSRMACGLPEGGKVTSCQVTSGAVLALYPNTQAQTHSLPGNLLALLQLLAFPDETGLLPYPLVNSLLLLPPI